MSDTRWPDGSPSALVRGALGLGIVAVIVVAVAALETIRSEPPTERRPRVAVVGDSLTMLSTWVITERLGAAGYNAAVAGVNGADIAAQHDQLLSYTGWNGAEIIVAALGTNNAYFASLDGRSDRYRSVEQSLADLERAVRDILEGPPGKTWTISVRCLVWVNVNDRTETWLREYAPAINHRLAELAEEQTAAGHTMLIADWAAASAGHDEWFVDDHVHLTEVGQRAYAELIVATVQRCPR
ncbi:MAG: SGNH/GDSL hydrolase family protein [Acidimicrobiales bacterium]|nr:SGNH/GDSL hydrolase family protein [Acidimicrobiales bacterium]